MSQDRLTAIANNYWGDIRLIATDMDVNQKDKRLYVPRTT